MKLLTTDKERVALYMDEKVKESLKRLAAARQRSLSNLIEVICAAEVKNAIASGELSDRDE